MCGHVSLLCLCLLFVSSSVQGGQENLPSTWTRVFKENSQGRLNEDKERAEKKIRMFTEQLDSCNSRLEEAQKKLTTTTLHHQQIAETLRAENQGLKQQLEESINKFERLEGQIAVTTGELKTKISDLMICDEESTALREKVKQITEKVSGEMKILAETAQLKRTNEPEYYSKTQKLNWYDAQKYCRSIGQNLIKIESDEKNQIINDRKNELGMENSWIGATDEAVEGTWQWIGTNQTMNYNFWEIGQPGGGRKENCVEMRKNGEWHDYWCSNVQTFICER